MSARPKYEAQLTHTTGPRAWFFYGDTVEEIKAMADEKMRLVAEPFPDKKPSVKAVPFERDCWVYTNGDSPVGLLVIDQVVL